MRRRVAWWLIAILGAVACGDAGPAEPEAGSLHPAARAYLDSALDAMQLNSIKRHEIEWVSFRAAAFADADGAQTPAATYHAIRVALVRLGDDHSLFRPPRGRPGADDGVPSPRRVPSAAVRPTAELIRPQVGYVHVPAFAGGGAEGDELATSYHRLMERVDTSDVCRWIVDLRGNTGGNMWPMLAGIGPVLGESSIVGYFVDPDSVVTPWYYRNGASGTPGSVIARAGDPISLGDTIATVAVLTDSLTASSGEAVAIAFRARPHARSFGQPTWGVSTANAGFELSDGATIFLTVSTMADRAGEIYGGEVIPDELVAGAMTGDTATDAALRTAMHWLLAQTC